MYTWLSILLILFSILVVFGNIFSFVYKKIKNKPTGECAYCHINKKKILKEYYKKYKNK